MLEYVWVRRQEEKRKRGRERATKLWDWMHTNKIAAWMGGGSVSIYIQRGKGQFHQKIKRATKFLCVFIYLPHKQKLNTTRTTKRTKWILKKTPTNIHCIINSLIYLWKLCWILCGIIFFSNALYSTDGDDILIVYVVSQL